MKIIGLSEARNEVELICEECGIDHSEVEEFDGNPGEEFVDFVILSDGKEEICRCVSCDAQKYYGLL